jgi:hypothetical protein
LLKVDIVTREAIVLRMRPGKNRQLGTFLHNGDIGNRQQFEIGGVSGAVGCPWFVANAKRERENKFPFYPFLTANRHAGLHLDTT